MPGGNCPSGELFWWAIVLVGSCPVRELSLWGIFQVGSCPGGKLSWWGIVLVKTSPGGSCPVESCPRTSQINLVPSYLTSYDFMC